MCNKLDIYSESSCSSGLKIDEDSDKYEGSDDIKFDTFCAPLNSEPTSFEYYTKQLTGNKLLNEKSINEFEEWESRMLFYRKSFR